MWLTTPDDRPGRVAEDHDVLQGVDLVGDALDPFGEVGLDDQDPGPESASWWRRYSPL